MIVKPITISSKGQISLPKRAIKHLGSKLLRVEIANDNEIKIIPIKDVAGSLSGFAKNGLSDFTISREKAWEKETEIKYIKDQQND